MGNQHDHRARIDLSANSSCVLRFWRNGKQLKEIPADAVLDLNTACHLLIHGDDLQAAIDAARAAIAKAGEA